MSACWELLHSEAFFLLLSNFTGLRLHYLCPADDDDDDNEEEEKEEGNQEKKKEEVEKQRGEETGSSADTSANTRREKGVCQYELNSSVTTLYIVCVNVLTCVCSVELSTPVCCGELRRWSHGCYTLLHDGEAARAEYALDLVLPFGCAGESIYKHVVQ